MRQRDDEDIRGAIEAALADRQRELGRLTRLYAALTHINQEIVAATDRDGLFAAICRVLGEHGGFRMSWIGWHVPADHRIVPVAAWGDDTGYLQQVTILTDDQPEAHGPTGTAFREGRPHVSNDVLNDRVASPWHATMRARGFLASAAFPIREGGEVRGTLSVYADEVGFFRDQEVGLLAEAARNLSFALDNLARETSRREGAEQVRRERDFSAAVLDSLPGVLYLYDRGGRFLRWNRNLEHVTGYAAAEIATMAPLELFEPTSRPHVAVCTERVFEHGASSVEAQLLAKDGTATPYHFTGVRTELAGQPCLVGVGIDVSAQRRAEAAQRASDARYRVLFDYAPDGIVVADAAGVYLDANASACRMLGYSRDELIGLHATDIVVQDEVPMISLALRQILGAADYHREWAFRRKDGSIFPADVIATLMPDGNVLALIRDATARKQAERALRELNESLEHKVAERTAELVTARRRAEDADRLKSAFLATMSHELRTPLNSILGFTGIVLQGMAGPLTPEQQKQLAMVRGSARHLLELINDVLDLSKIEADQLEIHAARFAVRTSVERVIATVTPQAAARGLTLTTVIDPALGELVSDRRRVEQILLNLVNNAIKFTERGGVTVTAVPTERAGVAAVRIAVADTGIGIRPEDLPNLFRPFRQLETGITRRHEGTGLGLAICRRMATLLGGEVTAASTWQEGSVFTLLLPLILEPAP